MEFKFRPLGSNGLLELGSVGDGAFEGVILNSPGCTLYFRSWDGSAFRIGLAHVVALQANDFRQGNIVNKVILYPKNLCPSEVFMAALGYAPEEYEKYYEVERLKLQEDDWSLLEIVPSYGCALYVIFHGSEKDVAIADAH